MKRLIILIVLLTGALCNVSAQDRLHPTHTSTTRSDEITSFITQMYNNKLYEDYDFLRKHCSSGLLNKLQDVYPYDADGIAYATMWLDAKLGELILKSTGLSDKVYNPDILFYDRICLTKDEKWAHEKEWRVVCYPERQCEVGKPIEMTTPTPKAIYYGVNILPENLSMLRSVVQALSSISPTPIKEYQMKINNFAKGFELTAELLQ